MEITYTERRALACRGPNEPMPDTPVEGGILLVGATPALTYGDNQSPYGEDQVSLYPAIWQGARAWLRRAVWYPAAGYSASGTEESILGFEEGCRILIERGVFAFPAPAPAARW